MKSTNKADLTALILGNTRDPLRSKYWGTCPPCPIAIDALENCDVAAVEFGVKTHNTS